MEAVDLVLMHALLFSPMQSTEDEMSIFRVHRKTMLESLLKEHFVSLSDNLDRESLPFQLSLLHHRVAEIRRVQDPQGGYNFYSDPNIAEARKGATTVETLANRLDSLMSGPIKWSSIIRGLAATSFSISTYAVL